MWPIASALRIVGKANACFGDVVFFGGMMADRALMAPKESAKAYQAFVDYVNLGPTRSLRKLVAQYNRPPTYLRQLAVWSNAYDWQGRLKQLAADQLDSATELKTTTYVTILGEYHRRISDEPRRQIMELTGLHGIYDRVKPERESSGGSSGGSITVQFAFIEATRAE